jgi:hypothetical protein
MALRAFCSAAARVKIATLQAVIVALYASAAGDRPTVRNSPPHSLVMPLSPKVSRKHFSRWLAGLFLLAHFFGVVPLVSAHLVHVAEMGMAVAGADVAAASIPDQHHHHHQGNLGGCADHHALQDLNGTLIGAAGACVLVPVASAVATPAPVALTEADPIFLERPPKLRLSI